MRFFSLNQVYRFMRVAPYCSVASALVMLATVVALFYPGPKLGTDFIGGTEIEVAFNAAVPAEKVRAALAETGLHDADVVAVRAPGTVDHYIIRVSEVSTIWFTSKLMLACAWLASFFANASPSPSAPRACFA